MPFAELTPTELHAELERYRVIDVREDYEFHGPLGFVAGAELVPMSKLEDFAAQLRGARVLLVCRSGRRSGTACQRLQELGIEDVTNLAGGMIAWNRAGLPVTHSEPRSLAALIEQIVLWQAQVGPLSEDAARDRVRERFERQGVSPEAPTHGAVEEWINFVGESLEEASPPDLDLSLDSFRRFLAVL